MAWPPVAQALTTAMLWPAQPVFDRDLAGCGIGQHVRQEEGRDAAGPALEQRLHALADHRDPADAGADHHAEAIRVGIGQVVVVCEQPRVAQRLAGGCHREVRVAIVPAHVARIHVLGGVELLHLAADMDLVVSRIEEGDIRDPGSAAHQRVPGGVDADPDRRDGAKPRDDHAALGHGAASASGSQSGSAPSIGWVLTSGLMRRMRPLRTRPGTDLHEVSHAVVHHAPHGRGPLHAVDQVLRQLGAELAGGVDHRGVDVAQHRHARLAERHLGQDLAELVARAAHQRRVAGDAHGQPHGLAGADRPAHLEREGERRDHPGEHDLPGGVGVGDADLAVLASRVDDLVHLLVGQADDGAHAALDAALLHDPAALTHERNRIREVDRVGGDRRRVLACRMAGEDARLELDARLAGLGAHRLEVGDAGGQDGRLSVDRQVELLRRPLGDQARERKAERRIGALQDGGRGRGAAHEVAGHADVLRALARENEGVYTRLRGIGRRSGIGLVGHGLISCENVPGV